MAESAGTTVLPGLPLFPLRTVLFPGGLLNLKVFEARYLDMVSQCLREQRAFGVLCLQQGQEVQRGKETARFEEVGVLARLLEVDAEQPGILQVRCVGDQRFRLRGAAQQRSDGLWWGDAVVLDDDEACAPSPALQPTVQALANAMASLKAQGELPFLEPTRLGDAGWVANRWCEILPITLAAKQRLMQLEDPGLRLQLVDEYLRGKGVVG